VPALALMYVEEDLHALVLLHAALENDCRAALDELVPDAHPASVNANIADTAAAAKLLLEMLFIAPPCQSMKIGKLTCLFYLFLKIFLLMIILI